MEDIDDWNCDILALRTIKCESVGGVAGDVAEGMRQTSPNDWFSSGEYGMVQIATAQHIRRELNVVKMREGGVAGALTTATRAGDEQAVADVLRYIYNASEKVEGQIDLDIGDDNDNNDAKDGDDEKSKYAGDDKVQTETV